MSEGASLFSQLLDYQNEIETGTALLREEGSSAGDKARAMIEQFGTPIGIHYLKGGLEKYFGENSTVSKALESLSEGGDVKEALKAGVQEAKGKLEDVLDDARQQAEGLVQSARDQVEGAVQEATTQVQELQGSAQDLLDNVQETGASALRSAREAMPNLENFVPQIPDEMNERLNQLDSQIADAKQRWSDIDLFDPNYAQLNREASAEISQLQESRDLVNFLKDDMVNSQREDFLAQGREALENIQGTTEEQVGNLLSSAAERSTNLMDMFASRAHGLASGDFSTLRRALGMDQPQAQQEAAAQEEAEEEFVRPPVAPGESVEMTQIARAQDESRTMVPEAEATAQELAGAEVGESGLAATEEALAAAAPETEGLSEIVGGLVALGGAIASLFHKDKPQMVHEIPTIPTIAFGF